MGLRRPALRDRHHLVFGGRRPLHGLHPLAVPGLVFGMGAIGFFALPYTIIVYPLVFLIMPKLWQIAHNRGLVTPADYVKERFDSPSWPCL